MMATWRWWALAGVVALVGAIPGVAIWRVYAHPPLMVGGLSHCPTAVGLDLNNRGRWPLRLTGLTASGNGTVYRAEAVASSGEMAFSAAVRMVCRPNDALPPPLLQTGPVEGWVVDPAHTSQPPGRTDGVLLQWEQEGRLPDTLVIHYRYAFLPMELAVHKNFMWKPPGK